MSETAKAAFTIAPHDQFPRIPRSPVPQRADKANIAPTKHPSQHVTAIVPTIAPPHSEKSKITYLESSRHRPFPGLGAARFTPNLLQIPVSTPDLVQPHSGLPWPVTQISTLQETLSGSESNKTPRCNRCILHRRKCDGRQPRCGLCLERGAECVYDKAGITRAYLEKMQKGAEGFRQMSASNTAALMGANAEAKNYEEGKDMPVRGHLCNENLLEAISHNSWKQARVTRMLTTWSSSKPSIKARQLPSVQSGFSMRRPTCLRSLAGWRATSLMSGRGEGYARLQLNWPERQSGGSDVTEGELQV